MSHNGDSRCRGHTFSRREESDIHLHHAIPVESEAFIRQSLTMVGEDFPLIKSIYVEALPDHSPGHDLLRLLILRQMT